MTKKNFFIAFVAGLIIALGVLAALRLSEPAAPVTALIIPSPTELPELALLDQAGNSVTRETFRGQWNLVFFGFTHCPDICPTTLQTLSTAQRELRDAGAKTLPRIVLVSVDPERDTPEALQRYVDHFGSGHLAVTGDVDQLRVLTKALGIYFEKVYGEDGEYTVDHTAAVLVINPEAEFSALFSAPHIAENYVHDLPIVMGRR